MRKSSKELQQLNVCLWICFRNHVHELGGMSTTVRNSFSRGLSIKILKLPPGLLRLRGVLIWAKIDKVLKRIERKSIGYKSFQWSNECWRCLRIGWEKVGSGSEHRAVAPKQDIFNGKPDNYFHTWIQIQSFMHVISDSLFSWYEEDPPNPDVFWVVAAYISRSAQCNHLNINKEL